MLIGIATGHSSRCDGDTLWEWQRCHCAEEELSRLLMASGHQVVRPPPDSIYQLSNSAALNAKIRLFNQRQVDLAVELHLNAGCGGDYSLCLHHGRSKRGKQLAAAIGLQFDAAFPWRSKLAQPGKTFTRRRLAFLHDTAMPMDRYHKRGIRAIHLAGAALRWH